MAAVWTQADLQAVTAAIVALATGARVTMVSYAGPPARQVEYGAAQLGELRALQAEIQRELNGSARFRRAVFSKGFDDRGSGG